MRKFLLTSVTIFAPWSLAVAATTITPGHGTLTDSAGNVWMIQSNGSIKEGNIYTPGGGGTAALTIDSNGLVYGLDAHGRGWFTLSSNAQAWTPSSQPASVAAALQTTTPTAAATATQAEAVTLPPAPACSPAYTPLTPGTGTGFHVVGGQIIGPGGRPFIARGINMGPQNMKEIQAVLTAYPGLNFIRLSTWYSAPYSVADYQAFISITTAKGIVVEIEDHSYHTGGNPAFTGAELAAESAWFASLAKPFAGNPYVWFGSMNEPKGSGADITAQEVATYNAIRGAGNNSIIMMEVYGGGVSQLMGTSGGQIVGSYAFMKNIVWDVHYYDWPSGYSAVQAEVDSVLAALIGLAQQITSADGKVPVIIGEYGDSTDGKAVDGGWKEVITAVVNLGGKLQYGSAAWEWSSAGADALLNADGTLSTYGQMVALYINVPCLPPPAAPTQAPASSAQTSATTIVASSALPPQPGSPEQPAAADPPVTPSNPVQTAAQMQAAAASAQEVANSATAAALQQARSRMGNHQ